MLKSMAVDLTFRDQEPFKIEIPDIQGDINVIIGQNGTGKTMYLTCVWFAGFLLKTYQVALVVAPTTVDTTFKELADQALSMTFNHHEGLNGVFSFGGQSGTRNEPLDTDIKFEFILAFEEGKLVNFSIDLNRPEDYAKIPMQDAVFNSKEARQFTSYERYIQILDMADIKKPRTVGDFQKVSKVHKLYDIMWFERVRSKFEMWEKDGYSEHAIDTLVNFNTNWPSDSDAFGPNPKWEFKENVPWVKSDTIHKKLSEFGSGHQAVLMTTLFV